MSEQNVQVYNQAYIENDAFPIDDKLSFFDNASLEINEYQPKDINRFLLSSVSYNLTINDPIFADIRYPLFKKISEYTIISNDPKFNEHEITTIIWSLHHLKLDLDTFEVQQVNLKQNLIYAIGYHAKKFNSHELASCILSLAHLGIYLPRVLNEDPRNIYYQLKSALLESLNRIVSLDRDGGGFNHQEVANIIWGFANLSLQHNDSYLEEIKIILLNTISIYIKEGDLFKPQEVSSIIWSLPKLGFQIANELSPVKNTILDLIKLNIAYFSPQGISNTLLGLSKLGYVFDDSDLKSLYLETIQKTSLNQEPQQNFIPQHVSNILLSLYKLGLKREDDIYQKLKFDRTIFHLIQNQTLKMNAQGIANSLTGLVHLGFTQKNIPHKIKKILFDTIEKNLSEFTLQGLVNTLRSLAKLKILWNEIEYLGLDQLLITMLKNPNTHLKVQEATQIQFFTSYYHLRLPQECYNILRNVLNEFKLLKRDNQK